MQAFTVNIVHTIDEIHKLVGLHYVNILPANFIENLLPQRDNNMKTVMNK